MANPEHLAKIRQGVEGWNAWRAANPLVLPELNAAELIGLHLNGAELADVDLAEADLRGAKLSRAELTNARLCWADLSAADLRRARLTGTDLTGAFVHEADLDGSEFGETIICRVDLSEAKRLESVQQLAPRSLGVDTLFRSGGKIPEAFLRGCGVSDALISNLPSLLDAAEPIQYYSCFISHSTRDAEFTGRLHSRMRDEHLRVWYAPEDLKGGRKLFDQLDDAIRHHDNLLLVLSEASMCSEWVATEVYKARQQELLEGRRVLFPIRLVPFERVRDWSLPDADTGKDLAREVREYFVPDFSGWKDHDRFEAAFKRLLEDLRADAGAREELPPAKV